MIGVLLRAGTFIAALLGVAVGVGLTRGEASIVATNRKARLGAIGVCTADEAVAFAR